MYDYLNFKLLPHQEEVISNYLKTGNKSFGLYLDLGLGKSVISMVCAIEKYLLGEINSILVVCPSGLITNWEQEIQKSIKKEYHFLFNNLKKASNLQKRTSWNIVSHSQLSLKCELPSDIKTIVIVDESHNFKNPASKRSKLLLKELKKYYGILSLSGTPKTNSSIDLFVQTKFLGIDYTKTSYVENHCFEKIQNFGGRFTISYTNTIKNESELMDKFKPVSSWIKKENVLDLPEKIFSKKYYELNRKQKLLINKFNNELPKDLDTESTEFANKFKSYLMALNMIHSGFFYNQETKELEDLGGEKIELLKTLIDSIGEEQLIIFCTYHGEIAIISDMLSKLEISFSVRHGKISPEKKAEAINDFTSGKSRILLATTASSSEGLTLTNCNNIIYYSNDFNLKSRLQSQDRIHRIGQTKTCNYLDLVNPNGFDEVILTSLNGKNISLQQLYTYLK